MKANALPKRENDEILKQENLDPPPQDRPKIIKERRRAFSLSPSIRDRTRKGSLR